MNRIFLWLLATATIVVLLFGYHTSTEGSSAVGSTAIHAPVRPSTGSSTSPGSSSGSGSSSSDSSGSTSSSGSSSSATGTFTGASADTRWGPVQVAITMKSGKITDVQVPVYPDGNGRDAEINSYALPILVKETIDAQTAQIDMVSGATVTSGGYLQSLQSALDQAS